VTEKVNQKQNTVYDSCTAFCQKVDLSGVVLKDGSPYLSDLGPYIKISERQ
jgi:hypothetical protein